MSRESLDEKRPDPARKFYGAGPKGLLIDLLIYLVLAAILAPLVIWALGGRYMK